MGISRIFKRGNKKMPSGFPKNRKRLSRKLRQMQQQQKAQALAEAVTRKEKPIEQETGTGEEGRAKDVQEEVAADGVTEGRGPAKETTGGAGPEETTGGAGSEHGNEG